MRSKGCGNPFKLGGGPKKHSHSVKPCSVDRISELRNRFPEIRFENDLKMCVMCRTDSFTRLNQRNEVRHAVQSAVETVANAFLNARISQRCEDGVESVPSAPSMDEVNSSISEGFNVDNMQQEPVPGPSTRRFQDTANAAGYCSTTSSPNCYGASTIYPSFVTESSYIDHAVAKEKLNHSFLTMGQSPIPGGIKSRPRRLREKASRYCKKWKSLFQDAFGISVVEKASECQCEYCIKMGDAICAKVAAVAKGKKEQYMIMTCLPPSFTIQKIQERLEVTSHVAKQVSLLRKQQGPLSFPEWKSCAHPITDHTKNEVYQFFQSDDNSRVSPNSKESVLVTENNEKIRLPRRIMYANLKDSYKEFKTRHPTLKIGKTRFAQLRPKNCRWPGAKGFPVTCLCIIHENFKLMMDGLRNALHDILEAQEESSINDVVTYAVVSEVQYLLDFIMCNDPKEDCYLGYCEFCPIEPNIVAILDLLEDEFVDFFVWETKTTTVISKVSLKGEEFGEKFRASLVKYLEHEYVYRKQKEFVANLKVNGLSPNVAVINVDFGENYSFVVQDAVQGFHWNNQQATIHPFVCYCLVNNEPCYKTYFVISDDLKHDSSSFHVFRSKVINLLKNQLPEITHIEYVSDGAGSQYKNFKNICNLVHHQQDYQITANWHFTATAHGKSTCDGMSAVVKRFLRLKSINERLLILSSTDMFNVATQHLTSSTLEFIHVSKQEVDVQRETLLEERYENARKVPGIRKFHCFGVQPDGFLIARRYSSSEAYEKFTMFIADKGAIAGEPRLDEVLQVGTYYAVLVGQQYQIGKVLEDNNTSEECKMAMMKKTGQGGVALQWPAVTKIQVIPYIDVLCRVDQPTYFSNSTYRLSGADLKATVDMLSRRKKQISVPSRRPHPVNAT